MLKNARILDIRCLFQKACLFVQYGSLTIISNSENAKIEEMKMLTSENMFLIQLWLTNFTILRKHQTVVT